MRRKGYVRFVHVLLCHWSWRLGELVLPVFSEEVGV